MANVNVDYKLLKNNIIKACTSEKDSVKFNVNFDKLSGLLDDIGLVVLRVGERSKKLDVENMNILAEYFKGAKLSWLGKGKEFTTLTFLCTDSIDEKCNELIEKLHTLPVDDPEIDHVKVFATILAEYPCYCATIVSYMSNGPKRFGKASYEIKIRANTVAIKDQLYNYNQSDMD